MQGNRDPRKQTSHAWCHTEQPRAARNLKNIDTTHFTKMFQDKLPCLAASRSRDAGPKHCHVQSPECNHISKQATQATCNRQSDNPPQGAPGTVFRPIKGSLCLLNDPKEPQGPRGNHVKSRTSNPSNRGTSKTSGKTNQVQTIVAHCIFARHLSLTSVLIVEVCELRALNAPAGIHAAAPVLKCGPSTLVTASTAI